MATRVRAFETQVLFERKRETEMRESRHPKDSRFELPTLEERVKHTQRRKHRKWTLLMLLVLGLFGAAMALKTQRVPVQPLGPAPERDLVHEARRQTHDGEQVEGLSRSQLEMQREAYRTKVEIERDRVETQCELVLDRFQSRVERIMDRRLDEMELRIARTAENVSSLRVIAELVGRMAVDKVRGKDTADAYLTSKIDEELGAIDHEVAAQLKAALVDLDEALRDQTLTYATELAQLATEYDGVVEVVDVDPMSDADLEQTMANLGVSASVLGLAGIFDVVALSQAQFARSAVASMGRSAGRVFGAQIARGAPLVGAAGLDGPLPFGDVLTVFGLGWTAWEVHGAATEFEDDVRSSLQNEFERALRTVENDAMDKGLQLHDGHTQAQDDITATALVALLEE